MISLSFIQAGVSANSIGNYLESKITVGSGAPTGESILIQSNKKSQNEINCKNSGCFLDKKCYPYGYIINNQYCAEEFIVRFPNGQERYTKKDIFVNQSETGKECNNNFKCLTNSCLNGICINQSEEIQKRIEEEVSKEVDERKDEAFEKIESQLEQNENAEILANKNMIVKILNWFKGI